MYHSTQQQQQQEPLNAAKNHHNDDENGIPLHLEDASASDDDGSGDSILLSHDDMSESRHRTSDTEREYLRSIRIVDRYNEWYRLYDSVVPDLI